jgi:hypothetical protein
MIYALYAVGIFTAWTFASIPLALVAGAVFRLRDHPRPSERHEQRVGQEVCEGGGLDRRHSGSNLATERSNHG